MQAILNEEVWAPRASIRAQVMGGIVDLSGVIFDERERSALRVAAEDVEVPKRKRRRGQPTNGWQTMSLESTICARHSIGPFLRAAMPRSAWR